MAGSKNLSRRTRKKRLRKTADQFRAVSHTILQRASLGMPRSDFVRDVLTRLIDFSGCDEIDLWLIHNQDLTRYLCVRKEHGSITLNTLCGEPGHSGLDRLADDVMRGRTDPRKACFTKDGTYFTGNAADPDECGHPRAEGKSGRAGAKNPYPSLIFSPLTAANQRIGLLQIKSKTPGCFTKFEVDFYARVARNLALAFIYQSAQAALRERIKELTCLFGITRIGEEQGISVDGLLEKTANLLPPAWQYPEFTAAAITFDGRRFATTGFAEEGQRQSADIVVHGQRRGSVEVVYTREMPDLGEGPFLMEEWGLITAVAAQIGMIIERRMAEDEKRRLQGQLLHADRLATIGQLSAGVAHELNEPLGTILGFAQLAGKSEGLPEQVRQDLQRIVNASLHARKVIQKLMMFAHQTPPQKTLVNLNNIVKEGLYFVESRCQKQGIEVIKSLDPELPEISADAGQLHQVLVNLAVNAVQAMVAGGKLTLRTVKQEDHIDLIVDDSGIGMSPHVVKQIFLPFFTTKQVGEGIGLGLSVVHGIVTGHAGSIKVYSQEGWGSRFTVSLPIETSRRNREVGDDESPAEQGPHPRRR